MKIVVVSYQLSVFSSMDLVRPTRHGREFSGFAEPEFTGFKRNVANVHADIYLGPQFTTGAFGVLEKTGKIFL